MCFWPYHAMTWPSHPPDTSTRPTLGTCTNCMHSTDHVVAAIVEFESKV